MVVVLVGNKSDLGNSREVNIEDGQSLAQLEGLSFLETSAMENLNVEEAFLQMIKKIHEIMSQKSLETKMNEPNNTPSTLQGKKEVINIDEITATKQAPNCCLY